MIPSGRYYEIGSSTHSLRINQFLLSYLQSNHYQEVGNDKQRDDISYCTTENSSHRIEQILQQGKKNFKSERRNRNIDFLLFYRILTTIII